MSLSHRKPHWICGAGFSREDVGLSTINSAAWHLPLSRLKPVLQRICGAFVELGLAGKTSVWAPSFLRCGTSRSRLKPVLEWIRGVFCGTGFSREDAGLNTINSGVWRLTLSRLKPVLHWIRGACVGPALAGKAPV